MTDQPTSSLRRRAAGIAASALMLANVLAAPAAVMAAGPGTPPTLVNDVINTTEDAIAPSTGNVLTNDSNPSGVLPFTVTSFTGPAASVGILNILSDGSYTFTPAANFSGTGSATYMASNTKHEVGPATITINVSPVQDPPVAGDDTITVVEDTATNVTSAILANDSDPDGDTLSVTAVSNPVGGNVGVSGGVVTFTPTADLCGNGTGSFDYTLSATGGTDSGHATVNITCVNDAPVAVNDNASGTEDTDVQVNESVLVANDTDVEGDSLSVTGVSNPAGGTVSRSGGVVTFTPTANLCGNNSASFDYTVGDGNGGHDTGTVTIDLACVADPPVAHNDTVSGTEDTALPIAAGDLTANDTDADGDTLTVTDVNNADGGSVQLVGSTITFTPDADACGTAAGSFDYTVDDGGNGGSDTGHVSVDLDCVNDAPVANDDTATVPEDIGTDVTASILANDTDVEGDTLTVTSATNATGGTVQVVAGIVTFTPDAAKCGAGEGSFDYTVSDGTLTDDGSVTVDVTCVNHAPLANDDTVSGTEDTAVVISDLTLLTGNDTDADGDTLTVSAVLNPTGGTVTLVGGTITFTPDANACALGEGSFDYTVDDGNDGTDTGSVSVDISCVNDAPVAGDDAASGAEDSPVVIDPADLLTNDTDVEGDSLSVSNVSNATGGAAVLDAGMITFTPTANLCGAAAGGFDYTVTDGTDTDMGHVVVDITCVEDNPVAVDDSASTPEDTALVISDLTDLTGNDGDVDSGDTISVTGASNAVGGTVGFAGGHVTFTPTLNLCGIGAGSFDYGISDGHAGIDMGHVVVDITCVNDAPVANDDVATVAENSAAADHDVLANDTDVEGDTRSLTGATIDSPTHGATSVHLGKVSYTPAAGFVGIAVITYTISDGHGGTDSGTLTVTVTASAGPDVTPPHPSIPGLALGTGRVDDSASLRVSWSATDAGSGVASYQVQAKIGRAAYKTIYQGKGTSVGVVVPLKAALSFRVRATDKRGNRSGWATTTTHHVVAAQNLNPGVSLTGGWTFVASRASSGGGYSFATRLGAAATYTFRALQIAYVAPKMASGGFVKVFVDGTLVGRYSLHSTSLALGRVIARIRVTPGAHTIRVVNDLAGKRITHDAFVLLR